MSFNWDAAQTAVRTWVIAGSGLASSKVIWGRQDGNKLARPMIYLTFGDLIPLGSVDERRRTYTGTPGAEITETVIGQRSLALSIQASTDKTVGNTGARALLGRLAPTIRLPTNRSALRAAGLSPYDIGAAQEVSTVLDADWEGRALLVVKFYVAETATETGTIIESVETTSYMGVAGDLGNPDEIDI